MPLDLNNSEIAKQKILSIGEHKDTDMLSICLKIKNDEILVNVNSLDKF